MAGVAATMTVLLTGLLTGWALIVAIGAQNAFVLRQGIRREHVWPVITLCILADVVLIAGAVAGLGLALDRLPWLMPVARWAGGGFLIGYGVLAGTRAWRSARRARVPAGGHHGQVEPALDPLEPGGPRYSPRRALLTIAALTFLNPHMYLDLLLLGAIANQHGPEGRWWFYAGMIVASLTWFLALGLGSRLLAPVFRSPRAWRRLDGGIAVTMVTLGGVLIAGS